METIILTQATQPNFALHSLGWKAFQDLCITMTREILGQAAEQYAPTADGGRDGAFCGEWHDDCGNHLDGTFTVQCKFGGQPNQFLSRSSVSDEIPKARRLARKGLATYYILMTNYSVSAVTAETLKAEFEETGVGRFLCYGNEWIQHTIRESPRLRMLVPRVYGLGDLSQILDERAYAQGRAILDSMAYDLDKFVKTDAYARSAQALIEHGFVILLGEPACGKSTIAAALSLGALDEWKCQTMKLRTADEFVQHFNPYEEKQFFWVDDVFGSTQYQRDLAHDWNAAFPALTAALKHGAKVVFTSRDYIYRAAQGDVKVQAFPPIEESHIVVNVQELKDAERQQILYNHIKLGDQPRRFRQRIKPHLAVVASSPAFLPEIARRLGNQLFTNNLTISADSIMEFVEKPLAFLIDVINHLDPNCLAALAVVFMNGGALESPIEPDAQALAALKRLGSDEAGVRHGLNALNGTLVKVVHVEGTPKWVFRHPTVSDAIAEVVAKDPELLDVYLAGTRTEKLIGEIVCGEARLEGAKVDVPPKRYGMMIARLEELNWKQLCAFLAWRCGGSFLAAYFQANPSAYQRIRPSSFLSAVTDVDLLTKLHECGLLPEEERLRFLNTVSDLAVYTPDADFLTVGRIRAVFSEREIAAILDRVEQELVPDLDETVSAWRSNFGGTTQDDATDHYAPLEETLQAFAKEFGGNWGALRAVQKAIEWVEECISECPETDETEEEDWAPDRAMMADARTEVRSIFDDVDE